MSRRIGVVSILTLLLCSTIAVADSIKVCTFNIQFLGQSTRRRNASLAKILIKYDVVVVQELVAPPFPGDFPDGSPYKPDPEAGAFFGAMKSLGFEYWLSEEDTGTGLNNHNNGPATEWYVTFFKPDRIKMAKDLPHGFLASDLTDHTHYERVPYAFSFRTPDESLDFVLISVHLKPGGSNTDASRRKEELNTIANWIDSNDNSGEQDFIILGDMNIEDAEELNTSLPAGFVTMNDQCLKTNTNRKPGKGRPYDHVVFREGTASEIDSDFDVKVINLFDAFESTWNAKDGDFPGGETAAEYNHDRFRAHYSDHHPLEFRITIPADDDD